MIKTTVREANCPLCGGSDHERLVPTNKLDTRLSDWAVHSDIWICVCRNCGLVLENPAIIPDESPEYADKHYYNSEKNPAERHDIHQMGNNPLRWRLLKDRIDWAQIRTAADVGATGAWAALLKSKIPHLKSILVEPSAEAIATCRYEHPDVEPHHSCFETFDAVPGSIDLITFFYSIYSFSDPQKSLRKAWDLLSPNGRIMICISHLLMDVEVWSNGTLPWVDLDLAVRGVPLVYYSRSTLLKFLALAGFEATDTFIGQHPPGTDYAGRQEYYVIARKCEPRRVPLQDLDEVEHARRIIAELPAYASRQSTAEFVRHDRPTGVTLVWDDQVYREFVEGLLKEHAIPVQTIHRGQWTFANREKLVQKIADEERHFVLNVGWCPISADVVSFTHTIVRNCFDAPVEHRYGLWVRGSNGQTVIAKAFQPAQGLNAHLFPFPANVLANEIDGPEGDALAQAMREWQDKITQFDARQSGQSLENAENEAIQSSDTPDAERSQLLAFATQGGPFGGGQPATEVEMLLFLLGLQDDLAIGGNIVEIGVKEGRSLAVLASHLRQDELLFAIDPQTDFPEIRYAHVDHIKHFCKNAENLRTLIKPSGDVSVQDLVRENGMKSRFIHIDGNHTEKFVLKDILLSAKILDDSGVIALDDYMNWSGIGVSAAVFQFFSSPHSDGFVPVFASPGKFFITTTAQAQRYQRHFVERFSCRTLNYIETTWLGYPIISTSMSDNALAPEVLKRFPAWPLNSSAAGG